MDVAVMETLNRLEAELNARQETLVSEDGKELAAMVRRSLEIAKRQVAGEFY